MHDALGVRRGETRGELRCEIEDLGFRKSFSRQLVAEGYPGYILGHEKVCSIFGVEIEDSLDVGMIELRERERFTPELLAGVLVVETSRRQELDGDVALETRIPGEIDVPHPARTDLLEDPIVRESPADHD